jgi:hypothetical protein
VLWRCAKTKTHEFFLGGFLKSLAREGFGGLKNAQSARKRGGVCVVFVSARIYRGRQGFKGKLQLWAGNLTQYEVNAGLHMQKKIFLEEKNLQSGRMGKD